MLLFTLFAFSNFNLSYSQTKQRYVVSGEVNEVNFNKWINDIDSNRGNAKGYEIIRNVVSHCTKRGFFAEAYYILHNYKQYHIRDSNYFNYQMSNFDHFIAASNIDSTKLDFIGKYIKLRAPDYYGILALRRLYGYYVNQRMWSEAVKTIKSYQNLFPNYKTHLDDVIKILNTQTQNVSINNISKLINTSGAEWDPNPTPDGQYLYFSSSNRIGGMGGSDVWVSEMKDGKWTNPQNIGPRINSKNNETIDNVTTDGNGLLLSGNFSNTYGNFDIYYIEQENGSWGSLRHFPMPINSIHTDEGACISSDGQVMIFTSDRPGGVGEFIRHGTRRNGSEMGNLDLYICYKTPDGWSAPINLGESINTPYAERSPYLHPDGKTLYFSSEGHPGLGSLDVFKSTRLYDTSWAYWSKPINLGKEINTISDDWGYKIVVSGDSAIFSALHRTIGAGDWDIFSVTLPKEVQPEKVVTIKGRVLDTKGKPLEAYIKWEDLSNGKFMGELRSNANNGNYFIALPLGKNYGYFAEKSGYYPVSQNIDLTKAKAGKDIKVDIVMASVEDIIEKGKEVTINNIFFDYNKFELKAESYSELNRLFHFLNSEKDIKIEIIGHTDNIGGREFNNELSQKRAESVANYLIEKGLKRDLLSIKGLGSEKPIANNDSEENRAKNRRVEFKISKTK